jgi:hypothetical protein
MNCLFAVLRLGDFFHPFYRLAIKAFLDGDMGHGSCYGGPMPMFLTRVNPNHITGIDLLNRTAFPLHPATTGRHDEGLEFF